MTFFNLGIGYQSSTSIAGPSALDQPILLGSLHQLNLDFELGKHFVLSVGTQGGFYVEAEQSGLPLAEPHLPHWFEQAKTFQFWKTNSEKFIGLLGLSQAYLEVRLPRGFALRLGQDGREQTRLHNLIGSIPSEYPIVYLARGVRSLLNPSASWSYENPEKFLEKFYLSASVFFSETQDCPTQRKGTWADSPPEQTAAKTEEAGNAQWNCKGASPLATFFKSMGMLEASGTFRFRSARFPTKLYFAGYGSLANQAASYSPEEGRFAGFGLGTKWETPFFALVAGYSGLWGLASKGASTSRTALSFGAYFTYFEPLQIGLAVSQVRGENATAESLAQAIEHSSSENFSTLTIQAGVQLSLEPFKKLPQALRGLSFYGGYLGIRPENPSPENPRQDLALFNLQFQFEKSVGGPPSSEKNNP